MSLSKKQCRELFGEAVREYRESHDRCCICWIPRHATEHSRFSPGLQLCHLASGVNRKDHPANVCLMCSRCHSHEHNGGRFNGKEMPKIDLGVLLGAKQEMNELDCEALEMLTGYKAAWFADQVSKVPEFYQKERQQWRWN